MQKNFSGLSGSGGNIRLIRIVAAVISQGVPVVVLIAAARRRICKELDVHRYPTSGHFLFSFPVLCFFLLFSISEIQELLCPLFIHIGYCAFLSQSQPVLSVPEINNCSYPS